MDDRDKAKDALLEAVEAVLDGLPNYWSVTPDELDEAIHREAKRSKVISTAIRLHVRAALQERGSIITFNYGGKR